MNETNESREITLREAVATALPNILATTNPLLGEAIRWEMADTVLNMPEMQAIRRFIKAYDDLPVSVDQWANGVR